MNRHIGIAIGLASLTVVATRKAQAQLNVLDQTRSITVVTNGTVEPGDTDTDTLSGGYSNSLSSTVSQTSDNISQSCEDGGSQTSLVSVSLLSDNARAGGSGTLYEGRPDIKADSYYSVDFTVNSPIPLSLTGVLSGSFGNNQYGPQPTLGATITMTQTQGVIQTKILNEGFPTEPVGGDGEFGSSGSSPLPPFNIILEPGYSYNLTADVNAEIQVDSITTGTFGNIGVDFTAAVPEPATIKGLLAASGLLLTRRRGPKI